MHFQPSLPRLPIPKLEGTCRRYLDALRPLLPPDQYQRTEKIVKEFGRSGGDGEVLNRQLVLNDQRNKHTSFISGPWFDMYLADRRSIMLNYNPYVGMQPDPRTSDQADRATNLIYSAVRFRNALADGKLEPEVYHLNPEKSDTEMFRNVIRFVPSALSWYAAFLVKAFPLDMSQYSRLFSSTRIPHQHKDELVTFQNSRHVVVLRRGHFYEVEALQRDGLPVPPSVVYSQLLAILNDATPPPEYPLSYLTSLERDKWASARSQLVGDPGNASALDKIDSALFVMCLDDNESTVQEQVSHSLLHNWGANRWFDKSFSIIVTKQGMAAVNFEHAWGDGVAILRLVNELYKDTTTTPYIPGGGGGCPFGFAGDSPPPPSHRPEGVPLNRLEFKLSELLKKVIADGRLATEKAANSLSINMLEYHQYGRKYLKKMYLSPDAILQLSLQIAYYRQYKGCVPTYESCSTAAFRHGRTETIRSATMATKACSEAFERSHPADVEAMMKLIKECVVWHSKLVKEAATGQGFDRHLFALKTLAKEEGMVTMPLFEDPAYSYANHIILSTSTLSSDAVLVGGFAPVTPDGYGVGYGVKDDSLGCHLTTYTTRDGSEYLKHLGQVWTDLYDVMNGKNFKK